MTLKVIAGDFNTKGVASTAEGVLIMPKGKSGWRTEKFGKGSIESIEVVTEENKTSILGKAAWGVAGGVLLGGVGALAGLLGGGNKKEVVMAITFTDGRKALLSGPSKHYHHLLAVVPLTL